VIMPANGGVDNDEDDEEEEQDKQWVFCFQCKIFVISENFIHPI
jgi:hypothetical protein